jgi:hypothetical protein
VVNDERLSHLMHALVDEEPALLIRVDDIVAQGRRDSRRRRRTVVAAVSSAVGVATLAVAVPLLGLAGSSDDRTVPGQNVGPPVASATPRPPTTASTPTPSAQRTTATTSPGATASGTRTPGTVPASASATGPGPTATGGATEWLADPGMEAPTLGWNGFGHSPVLTRTAPGRSGGHALLVTSTDADPITAGATSNPVRVTTVAGHAYTASCWVRSDTKIEAGVQVQEYTTGWVRAGSAAKSPLIWLTDPASWYRIEVTYTAAVSGNLLPLTVLSPELGTPQNSALVIDDCSLTG